MKQTDGKAKRILKSTARFLGNTLYYSTILVMGSGLILARPFLSQKEYEGKAYEHMFDN